MNIYAQEYFYSENYLKYYCDNDDDYAWRRCCVDKIKTNENNDNIENSNWQTSHRTRSAGTHLNHILYNYIHFGLFGCDIAIYVTES